MAAGVVEPINKLMSVKAPTARYTAPAVGDVVVGRVTAIGSARWKVDLNARLDGVLLLSAVALPGAVQRRKTADDALAMHTLFAVGDILVAEVQQFYADGAIALHTRAARYGALRGGTLVRVPAALVKRLRSHFVSLSCGVSLVLGTNGLIWVASQLPKEDSLEDSTEPKQMDINVQTPEQRMMIARVANCIELLARNGLQLNESLLSYTIDASMSYRPHELLEADVSSQVLAIAQQQFMDSLGHSI